MDSGNEITSEAELEAVPETPRTNADKILDALADGPASETDLLAALDEDGGKDVKRRSVRTTISNLRRKGKIAVICDRRHTMRPEIRP
ncbi:hypothetical protein ACPCBX_06180 [Streptomyces tuirus]|uniref:Uncharacterized protein n=1 Tax=Streptomyces tuirus TaxID=68278 RepID=A0A7G1N9M7_9ACTN|nr:hypothetical protein [Streptomyces tuirus]BCL18244.1 hypothetical protein GCM10017668_00870 [Streptomyces tuirus]